MHWDTLDFLYHTTPGRMVLKILVHPAVSKVCGRFLDSSYSRILIKPFIKKNHIPMEDYERENYASFNECFYRKIKADRRPIPENDTVFMAPCDGLLSCFKIKNHKVIPVKQSVYTIDSLLRDRTLAKEYKNGWCLVFRLCVNHYHRYAYLDQGEIIARRRIRGMLHTVRPVALESLPVFVENSREYMVLDTKNFGRIIQMEVGAMLVGKIENYASSRTFKRGEEKGRFLYGGSTIIVLVKDGEIQLEEEFLKALEGAEEVPVIMGQKIATKISKEE